MLGGFVGLICSASKGVGAGKIAHWIYTTHSGQSEQGPSAPMTRAEFELYDLLKNQALIGFIVSLIVIIIGACGMRLARVQKYFKAKRVTRKSLIFGAIALMGGFALIGQKQEMKRVIREISSNHET